MYDTTTNALLRVSPAAYRILDDYLRYDPESLEKAYHGRMSSRDFSSAVSFLSRAKRQGGLLQPYFQKDFAALLDRKALEDLLSAGLVELTLGVTEQCNQRCTYCTRSGDYEGERQHNNAFMTWDIARKSIDYFLERMDPNETKAIGFYGGEPLLNWPLVERCIRYIQKKQPAGQGLSLHLVSNMTSGNDRIIDFLIDHDVSLQVSLDGPPSIHDSARVFRNGRGTHNKVLATLLQIWAKNADYFRKKILINCTFNLNNNILDIVEYFNDDLFRDLMVMVNGIKTRDNPSYKIGMKAAESHQARLDFLVHMYLQALQNGEKFPYRLFHFIFKNIFSCIGPRKIGPASAQTHPNATCVPGKRRLFVSAEGLFYPCEKFCPPGCDIGYYETGIDREKVRNLLHTYILFCDEMCQNCWAYRLCRLCFIHTLGKGRMSKIRKMENCEREKVRIARDLERFIYIWEREPETAFDFEFSLHALVKSVDGN